MQTSGNLFEIKQESIKKKEKNGFFYFFILLNCIEGIYDTFLVEMPH
jgi:hypothetical protein